MQEFFLFNSPPRSGNVFLIFLFKLLISDKVNKCLDIKKYSDKTQKQAAFFRNPYDSISSAVVKSRIDVDLPINEEYIQNIGFTLEWYAKEYLEAIKEAKANKENIYIGVSENMMNDPISTITDIALFFNFELKDGKKYKNIEVLEEIKQIMLTETKTRVMDDGRVIVENLMTDHDGHLPRKKIPGRILVDKIIKDLESDILKECYNEYISINPTNAKDGQRWGF